MKWECKIVQIEDNEGRDNFVKLQEEFNKYGSDGWEVVDILKQEPKGIGWLSNTEKSFAVLKKAFS